MLKTFVGLFILVLAVLTAFWFGFLAGEEECYQDPPKHNPHKKPNFIVFLADDMGYGDASSFGHPSIQTPAIDRMVTEGKRLKNHYTCPMCTPTRGSLLTGRLPIRTGLYNGLGWPEGFNFTLGPGGLSNYEAVEVLEQMSGVDPRKLIELGVDSSIFEPPPNSTCQNGIEHFCNPLTKVFYPGSTKGLASEEITIAEALKDVGYTSGLIGKWHLGIGSEEHNYQKYLPLQQGFDRFWGMPYSNDMGCPPGIGAPCLPTAGPADDWVPVPIYLDNDIVEQPTNFTNFIPRLTEESIRFIREAHEADKPFFLFYATVMPHVPIFTSNEFVGVSKRGSYGDCIQELDNAINDILGVVDELGLDQDTMSVFMSDNGPFPVMRQHGGTAGLFTGGKGTTWEGGIRSPAVVRWPSMITPNTITEGISAAWDIFSTILSIAGAEIPTDRPIDGIDLSPVLFNDDVPAVRECQNLYSQKYLMATRCGDFKVHWRTRNALSAPVVQDPPLLFNVETDPSELYPLPNSFFQQVIDAAAAYRTQFEASFEPAESLFEYINEANQACCCAETNCNCVEGYVCDGSSSSSSTQNHLLRDIISI